MATVWLNGTLVDEHMATVSALDRGIIWGYGLFETLRAYDGVLWAADAHHERLAGGAELLELAVPGLSAMSAALGEVIVANGLSDCGARLTVTAGAGPPDPHADADQPPNVLATAWPLRDYSDLYRRGARLITIRDGGRALAGVKTISYAVSISGRLQARRVGADDALFVRPDGAVLETTGSNLMAVFGTDVVTPAASEGLLPGVTRRTVLEVASSLGFAVSEAPLTLEDLGRADEVVLTSTLREAYPVGEIDGRSVGRAGHAEALRDAFGTHVRERLRSSKG